MAGRVATVDQRISASAFVLSLARRCASTPARALEPARSRSLIPLFIPLVSELDGEARASDHPGLLGYAASLSTF